MSNMIRIMVVDDHDLYREVLADFLERNGFKVTNTLRAGDGLKEVLATSDLPDILIISFKTSKPDNLMILRWLKKEFPSVRILITTLFNDKIPTEELKQLGVEGVIIKSHADTQQIVKALRTIYSGKPFFLH